MIVELNGALMSDYAEMVALKALAWLAGNDELFATFLTSSGTDAHTISKAAGDATFLASVLDFIVMHDEWVIALCNDTGLNYSEPMKALQSFPGHENIHWT